MIATNGNTRLWRHKSVRALIRFAGGGDPVEIIRSKSKEVVEWARRRGWTGPPFDPPNPRVLAWHLRKGIEGFILGRGPAHANGRAAASA